MKLRIGNVLNDGRCDYCDRYQHDNDSILVLTGNFMETRFCGDCLVDFKKRID